MGEMVEWPTEKCDRPTGFLALGMTGNFWACENWNGPSGQNGGRRWRRMSLWGRIEIWRLIQ